MASSSSSPAKLVFFASCLLLFTLSDNLVAGESDKVQLNLYYESLCPGCQEFIVDYLGDFFNTDLDTITNVTLVPFGNAKLYDNLTITCQHGEEECELNKVEACIINTLPDPKLQYSLIRCIENDTKNWDSCFNGNKDDIAIGDCYTSDLSTKLILEYAKQTLSLNPKKKYVPWVTLNGKPLYEKINDLVAEVCKAYKGKTPLPKQCNIIHLPWLRGKCGLSFKSRMPMKLSITKFNYQTTEMDLRFMSMEY